MSLGEVFNVLVAENNMDYEFTNNILKVSALKTKTFMIDYINAVREGTAHLKASTDSSPYETDNGVGDEIEDNAIKAVEKFDFWETISDEITLILNNGTEDYMAVQPIINKNAGLVTVTGTKSQLDRVDRYINGMQSRLKQQVMLDVSVISVDLSNSYSKGVDWSQFKLGFDSYIDYNKNNRNILYDSDGKVTASGGTVTGNRRNSLSNAFSTTPGDGFIVGAALNFNVSGMINFLELTGNTKTISSPKVMTLNNQPAIITVGDVINYVLLESLESTEGTGTVSQDVKQYSTFIGVLLYITPTIADNGEIILRINPSLSDFRTYQDELGVTASEGTSMEGARIMAPNTKERKISTVVRVNDGDTVILGGMIEQTKTKDGTSVPILSSIPLIGNIFKSSKDALSVTELVFIITPRLVNNTSELQIADSLKDLGYSKSTYSQYD